MALDSHPRNAAVAENLLVPDGRLVIIVTSTPFVREYLGIAAAVRVSHFYPQTKTNYEDEFRRPIARRRNPPEDEFPSEDEFRRQIPEDAFQPEDEFPPEDEFRRRIARRRIPTRRRIPPRRRIPKTNCSKTHLAGTLYVCMYVCR